MTQLQTTKTQIINELNDLPPEALPELRDFMPFLRFKSTRNNRESGPHSRRETWQTALQATFGLWADRDDIPKDGVLYTQNIRRGHRLDDLMEPPYETD